MEIALETIIENTECKGQVYRGRVEVYVDSRGRFVKKETLTPLKRKSCEGCQACCNDEIETDFLNLVWDETPLLKDGPGLYSVYQIFDRYDTMNGVEYDSEFAMHKIKGDEEMKKQEFIKKWGVQVLYMIARYSCVIMTIVTFIVLRGVATFMEVEIVFPFIVWVLTGCFCSLIVVIVFDMHEIFIKDVIKTFSGIEKNSR